MARVTVEDCLKYVDTNYDLVLKAAKRARDISEGAPMLVDEDNDKPVVVALREIADNVSAEEVLGADILGTPTETLLDQGQVQDPVEINIS